MQTVDRSLMYHNFLLAPRFIYIKYGVAASFVQEESVRVVL